MTKDPYRYFRIEARELIDGLAQGLLGLESNADKALVAELFRLAHTLKGASRVVRRPEIADLAHEIEDLLLPHRESGGPMAGAAVDRALALVKSIRALTDNLERPKDPLTPQESTNSAASPALREGVNIPTRDLDKVLQSATESHSRAVSISRRLSDLDTAVSSLKRIVRDLAQSDSKGSLTARLEASVAELERVYRGIETSNDRLIHELLSLKDTAARMRLVPAKSLTTDIEQIAREAARRLGKTIRFVTNLEITHLDASIESRVRTALVHIVQNSVAHGIESPEARRSSGKPLEGVISLDIRRVGSRLVVRSSDDGKGFDTSAIREALVRDGNLTSHEASGMDEDDLLKAASADGFSTSLVVSNVSGRGVGLGAAEAAIKSVRGTLTLTTDVSKGTTAELDAPFTLSLVSSLPVFAGEMGALIPLEAVRGALSLRKEDMQVRDLLEHVLIENTLLPYVSLARALSCPERESKTSNALVVQAKNGRFVLGVERIGSPQNVVLSDIPSHAQATDLVEGAALDEEGNPVLLLSPTALAARSTSLTEEREQSSTKSHERRPILVIDDSLTTRMLEQSILEAAGYEVELATSGEEGLKKAKVKRFGAFIVDVEMPHMNGFEFLAHVKNDPTLRETPSILVTSLDSPEHRRRGKDAGADEYMVKGDFDQRKLLSFLRRHS